MKLKQYTASHFAEANKDLLAPGDAWRWPAGGFGDALIQAQSQEFARLDAEVQNVIDYASTIHTPAVVSWTLEDYRNVANKAIEGVAEEMPRRTFAVGSHVGERLWSIAAPALAFTVPLLQVDHLVGPLRVGSHVGDRCWGTRSRYILRVRYYRSVVNPKALWDALLAFKQAHVYLWFEDITGAGGMVNYGQN